jgi:hypothetical protein
MFTKYHAIVPFDVTKLKREFAFKLQLLATFYSSSYRHEIKMLRDSVIMLPW